MLEICSWCLPSIVNPAGQFVSRWGSRTDLMFDLPPCVFTVCQVDTIDLFEVKHWSLLYVNFAQCKLWPLHVSTLIHYTSLSFVLMFFCVFLCVSGTVYSYSDNSSCSVLCHPPCCSLQHLKQNLYESHLPCLTSLVSPVPSWPPNMYRCPFREQPHVPDIEGGASPIVLNSFLQDKKCG